MMNVYHIYQHSGACTKYTRYSILALIPLIFLKLMQVLGLLN